MESAMLLLSDCSTDVKDGWELGFAVAWRACEQLVAEKQNISVEYSYILIHPLIYNVFVLVKDNQWLSFTSSTHSKKHSNLFMKYK